MPCCDARNERDRNGTMSTWGISASRQYREFIRQTYGFDPCGAWLRQHWKTTPGKRRRSMPKPVMTLAPMPRRELTGRLHRTTAITGRRGSARPTFGRMMSADGAGGNGADDVDPLDRLIADERAEAAAQRELEWQTFQQQTGTTAGGCGYCCCSAGSNQLASCGDRRIVAAGHCRRTVAPTSRKKPRGL